MIMFMIYYDDTVCNSVNWFTEKKCKKKKKKKEKKREN